MVIGTHAGLVGEEDPGTDALGLGGDRWVVLALLALEQHRIALARSTQWALRREPQCGHRPPKRRMQEFNAELSFNDLADQRQRPQRKLKAMLLANSPSLTAATA